LRSLLPAIVLLLTLCRGTLMAQRLLAPLPDMEHRLLVQACVRSVPALQEAGWRFDARVEFPRHPEWTARVLRMQLPPTSAGPAVGECWQYMAQLDAPQDMDGRIAMLRDHVSGYARITEGALNRRIEPARGGLDALRARIASQISDRVADSSAAALLAALAVGVTGEVSARQWQLFNATGITHLVAISGLHVTFFAVFTMAAARWLWRHTAPWPGWPRREGFAVAVGILSALLYALLSGLSVPAQRTVVMLAAFLGMQQRARCTRPAWSVAVALVAVLAWDPLAVFAAGFWLSFGAVIAIVVVAGGRLQPGAPLAAALRLQWVVSIALLPMTVAIFGSFSAVGLLANLLAIPLFTVLLVPLVLLATACHLLPLAQAAWCADALVQLAGWVAAMLWPLLCWCADLPAALWHATPPVVWYLLALPAAMLALLPLALPARAMAVALLASAFLLREPRPREGELWIDLAGEGNSATALLRTRNRLLLWGTAEVYNSNGRRFERLLLPRLRGAGYPAVDLWLPGNLTRDVQAALRQAAAQLQVRRVLLPASRGLPPEFSACDVGRWEWDGFVFETNSLQAGRHCLLAASRGTQRVELEPGLAALPRPAEGEVLRLIVTATGSRAVRL
jgi:competence protein ComEC